MQNIDYSLLHLQHDVNDVNREKETLSSFVENFMFIL